MSKPETHITEDLLLRYADRELDAAGMAAADRHLLDCGECRERLHEMQSALETFERHLAVGKLRQPPPPKPWADLHFESKSAKVVAMPSRSRVWMWVAAAACFVVMFAVTILKPRPVSAAELLEKAIVRERSLNSAPRKIRVKVRNLLYTRPARGGSEGPELQDVRKRFAQARYSWEDPLSASAYSAWRSQLPAQDAVTTLSQANEHYTVTTRTAAGDLAEVALTLRASDFRAVHEVFHFRDDVMVELSDAPTFSEPSAPPAPPSTPHEAPAVAQTQSARVTLGDEIRVLAALHAIGADLGEPVEVFRDETDGKLLVTATGLDAPRQEQLRAALASMPNLTLRFEAPESAPRNPRPNDVLQHSENVLAHAHALRNLAGRVPAGAESQLSADERRELMSMIRDHYGELQKATATLATTIGDAEAGDVAACSSWQSCAVETLRAARKLDTELTGKYASATAKVDETKPNAALADLLGRIAAWRPVL